MSRSNLKPRSRGSMFLREPTLEESAELEMRINPELRSDLERFQVEQDEAIAREEMEAKLEADRKKQEEAMRLEAIAQEELEKIKKSKEMSETEIDTDRN